MANKNTPLSQRGWGLHATVSLYDSNKINCPLRGLLRNARKLASIVFYNKIYLIQHKRACEHGFSHPQRGQFFTWPIKILPFLKGVGGLHAKVPLYDPNKINCPLRGLLRNARKLASIVFYSKIYLIQHKRACEHGFSHPRRGQFFTWPIKYSLSQRGWGIACESSVI